MRLGFEQRQLTHFRRNANGNGRGKNGADIQMTIDIIDMVHENTTIDTIVIVAGDSDFIPLIHRLKRVGKEITAVTLDEAASGLLDPNCPVISYNAIAGLKPKENLNGGLDTGIIVDTDAKRGYGFIESSNTDTKGIFFHASDVVEPEFDYLWEGDLVEYELEIGKKGPIAKRVCKLR